MTEQQPTPATDDVEGHVARVKFVDAERDETDDTEGHKWRMGADAERDETDDTEGHRWRLKADAERDETDDTEGHGRRFYRANAERDETDDTEGHAVVGGLRPTHPRADDGEDDVAGHLSGALGSKKKTDGA